MKLVEVDAEALYKVLTALDGPDHMIRELQYTRGPLFNNPIDKLIRDYNVGAELFNAAQRAKLDTENKG